MSKIGSGKVTLSDVAKRARVSVSTVSKVLRNKGQFSQATREQVLNAARELEYLPFPLSDQTRIGVLAVYGHPGEEDHFTNQVVRGISDYIQKTGLELSIVFSNRNTAADREYLKTRDFSGAILLGTLTPIRQEYADMLSARGIPCVGISRYPHEPPITFVGANNVETTKGLVLYLAGRGHTRIGYVGWERSRTVVGYDRYVGYRQGLWDAGLSYFEDYVVLTSAKVESAPIVKLLSLPHRPTAIVAFDDNLAAYVVRLSAELGLEIPKDLSIVSADDKGVAEYLSPPITAVKHDYCRIGRIAAQELIMQIKGETDRAPLSIYVASELRVRESVSSVREA